MPRALPAAVSVRLSAKDHAAVNAIRDSLREETGISGISTSDVIRIAVTQYLKLHETVELTTVLNPSRAKSDAQAD